MTDSAARGRAHTHADPTVNSRTWRILAWIGVALQAAALIAIMFLERWQGVPSVTTFLVLSVAFLLLQDRLPSLLTLLVIITAVVNAAGWAWNLYQQFAPFDEFIHCFTAFTGMAALGYLGWTRGYIKAAPGSGRFVVTVAAVGLVLGIGWELIEMVFLNLSWTDSLIDLLVDTAGAAAGGVFAGWVIRRQGLRHHRSDRLPA